MASVAGFHEVLFPLSISQNAVSLYGYNNVVQRTPAGKRIVNINNSESLDRFNIACDKLDASDTAQLIHFYRGRKGNGYGFRYLDRLNNTVNLDNFGRGDGSTDEFQLRAVYRENNSVISGTNIKCLNDGGTSKIMASDSSILFRQFQTDMLIDVEGFTIQNNNGLRTVLSVGSDSSYIEVSPDITDEVEGDSITIYFSVDTKTITKPLHSLFSPTTTNFQIWQNDVEIDETTHWTLDETTGLVTFVTPPVAGDKLEWSGEFHYRVAFVENSLPATQQLDTVNSFREIILEELDND